MPLVRSCRRCGKLITYSSKYCDKCKPIYDAVKKENVKVYDKYQRNDESRKIYNSKEWKKLTLQCKDRFEGLDVYQYYINGVLVYGELSHHIIEITEDESRSYDLENLIYLSDMTHKFIHQRYKQDKEATQKLLFELVERWKKENEIG